MVFSKVTIQLKDGSSILIIHNLPNDGPNNIARAIESWSIRTEEMSGESFCKYIDEKRKSGLGELFAFTEKQWEEGLLEIERGLN